jgi:hypothetical protein
MSKLFMLFESNVHLKFGEISLNDMLVEDGASRFGKLSIPFPGSTLKKE